MEIQTIIPVIAITISVLTFVMNRIDSHEKAGRDIVSSMEKRLEKCEQDFKNCEHGRLELKEENMRLLRELLQKEKS